ncbi:MAG: PLP-dependent cysteine synthase family protein, partial [Succinivibrio sp.]
TNNPDIHYKTTGYAIVNDLNGDVDYLVAGVGSGGTLSGTARYLKEKISKVKIVAVEPYDSAFLSSGKSSFHRLYGIGLPGFIPKTLDTSLIDEVIDIKANDAFRMVQYAARFDGILPGISSGAALDAAVKLGEDPNNTNKKIVVILLDGGERYLSTPAFLPLELS